MKAIALLIAFVMFPISTYGTETSAPVWTEVIIKAPGPKSAGEIFVRAVLTEHGTVQFAVFSEYGRYTWEEKLEQPLLNSLTIKQYGDYPGLQDESRNRFYLCMDFGTRRRYKRENFKYPEWFDQYMLIEYLFTPDGMETKRFDNDGNMRITNCWN